MTAVSEPETRTGHEDVRLGPVELDLLATHAGRWFPYPLRVPEYGRIAGERELLLAAAASTLRGRGLAGARGPLGVAAELVTALREYRGTIDLVLVEPGSATGIVAMVYRSWALICRQALTDSPSEGVWVRRVAQRTLTEELAGMVPEVEPAQAMPVTIAPTRDDADILDELGSLVSELTGSGQLGATRRGVRSGTELCWLDGPRGRVRVDRTDDGWLSVNPLRGNDLRFALDDLSLIARRENNGT